MHKSPISAHLALIGEFGTYTVPFSPRTRGPRKIGEKRTPARTHSLNAAVEVHQSRGGRHGSPGFLAGGVNPEAVIRSVRIARSFTAHGTRR